MKKYLIVVFLLLSVRAISQTFPKKVVDSLTAIALSHKCNHPIRLNRDSVIARLFLATSLRDRIDMFYDLILNYDVLRSLNYHELVVEGAQKRGDKVLEAVAMSELGYRISINGNTANGLKMMYASLEKAEATGNAQAIGIAYNNLGNCYPNNNQLSREYWTKGLEYSKKSNDYLLICLDLNSLAGLYVKTKKRDSALAYNLGCYRLAVAKNIEHIIPITLLALSKYDDSANALQYYRQAYLMPFAIRNAGMKVTIFSGIGYYYIRTKTMDSAFYYSSLVYNTTKKAPPTVQLTALGLMSAYYTNIHNADSALSYVTRHYNLKDSLYGNKVMEEAQSMAYTDMQRQKEIEAQKTAFQNLLIVFFLSTVAILLMGIAFVFWRSKRKEQQAKNILQQQKDKLEQTLVQLKTTQSQLIQSEKMASLGQLTAGIAHEIQNPLNFVNNFSEVNTELIDELSDEADKGNLDEVKAIAKDIKDNEQKINHHGKRADAIVKGMLQHSRSSSGVKEPTDINALCDEYFRLAYQGLKAKDKSFNATLKTDFDESIGNVNIIPQDIGRVILNLITNAFYAVDEREKQNEEGYQPKVTVETIFNNQQSTNSIFISVKDNGTGIPSKLIDKIFQPFFTTKPTGQGTGLGLSLSYDIVKAHGGKLKVETKEGEGTTFVIQLPG